MPYRLRNQMAWNHGLSRAVLRVYTRVLLDLYARGARTRGVPGGHTGSVTGTRRSPPGGCPEGAKVAYARQTVAVFGHGPLACLLAMVAAARKCRVLLVGKGGWRLERVRALGIGECLDADTAGDIVAALRAATSGRGPEVVVDATGRPEVWETAMRAVARGGCVVFFGGCAPGTRVALDTRRAHYEELTLVGAFHHTPELIRRAVELLESDAVAPEGLLTHRMGLEQMREALDLMSRGEALKVLITP